MAKINDIVEQRIKDAASIMDVLEDGLGVELHRNGTSWDGLCPFHNDKHLGSFKVSERKNICTCFSCGKTWNPIDALMQGKNMDYPTALRWLAAKYGIYIDSDTVPQVTKAAIRPKAPELPQAVWDFNLTKRFVDNTSNPLMEWMHSLPFTPSDRSRLDMMVKAYCVGTSHKASTDGWTIWWYVDEQFRITTGKLMKYKPDGHRDKDSRWSFTWIHSLMEKAGQFDSTQREVRRCLFGLHLTDVFEEAEVCIVESEKSALICSAFTNPKKRIWMATGGKSGLKRDALLPLIERGRYIVIYPDKDGYNEWRAMADMIGYNRLSVSNKVNQLWKPRYGDKADIADIMIGLMTDIEETPSERASRMLGLEQEHQGLATLINEFALKIEH